MKKYIAFLLCFAILFSLCSCAIYEKIFPTPTSPEPTVLDPAVPDETTTELQQTTPEAEQTMPRLEGTVPEPEETTPEEPKELMPPQLEGYPIVAPEPETNVFASYEEILDIYRLAIDNFDLIDDSAETIAHTLGFANVDQVEWFNAILTSAYLSFPEYASISTLETPEKLLWFHYAKNDLNGDGIEELILLTWGQEVLAVFSMVEGEPVLLDSYTPRRECQIDNNGVLHITEKGAGQSIFYSAYEITLGGKGLHKLVEYGKDDLWFPGTYYYKEVNGKKVSISYAEYQALDAKYGNNSPVWFSTFRLLSSTKILREIYQSAINSEVPIYFVEEGEYLFLKDYTPPRSTVPLSKRSGLKCCFANVNDEKMIEFVINYGDLLLLEYDYNEGVIRARSLTDKEKLVARGGVYYPLPAPWREVDINAIDIRKSMPGYWDTYNGFVETVGGNTVTNHIIVSPTPDENGYYLVTWQKEISPTGCACLDCDFEIPHEVKIQSRALVHAKTGEIIEIGISPQEAEKIASEYWDMYDGYVDYGLGTTFVMRIVVDGKPECTYGGMYYHVVWKIEYYSHEGYKNGAEPGTISDYRHLYVHIQTGECYMYPNYDGK